MSVAERLARLGPTDEPPTLAEIGGAEVLVAELPTLEAGMLPAAVSMAGRAEAVEADLIRAFIDRLIEINGPMSFDEAGETLIARVAEVEDPALAIALLDQLLAAFDARDQSDLSATRAGYAIQSAVDLARAGAGVEEHAILARLERVDEVPEQTAMPLARAAGRLAETGDSTFLITLLGETIMAHETASAQATLELGLIALRKAFDNEDPADAIQQLDQAIEQFKLAQSLDESRADAAVFSAAAQAVRALGSEDGAFDSALAELKSAKHDYDNYDPRVVRQNRIVGPIHSVAAWEVLASRLRRLREAVSDPDWQHLRPGLEVLADAYAGVALDTVADRRGLVAFTRPVIEVGLERDPVLAKAAETYDGPGELPIAERGEGSPKG